MKQRLIAFISIIVFLFCLCSCTQKSAGSTFSIQFIDVGQGDAALVECDGHYMLIDGGDASAGKVIREVLQAKQIHQLDILAVSHLHEDHCCGLIDGLDGITKIGITICNSNQSPKSFFAKFENVVINKSTRSEKGSKIIVPKEGKKYKLGSALVEVIDTCAKNNNDSLVLLITYKNTRFLFTGDIEGKAQKRLTDYLSDDSRVRDGILKVNLIKMPHHGAYNDDYGFMDSNLNSLFTLLHPDYAVISVGEGNSYNHPHKDTLILLEQADVKVYRTDVDGTITVKSNGKELSIETSKKD